jgi:hypothetical protein
MTGVGGIGGALVAALGRGRRDRARALAPPRRRDGRRPAGLVDVTDEATIRAATGAIEGPLDLVIDRNRPANIVWPAGARSRPAYGKPLGNLPSLRVRRLPYVVRNGSTER